MLQGPGNPENARNFAIVIIAGTHAYETAYICNIVANMYDYAKRIISFGQESVKLAD